MEKVAHYVIGDFKVIPLTNTVETPSGEKSIRPKSLQLLIFLLEQQDAIHSKQTLLDAVWQSAGAQEHVLFQSINEIRAIFKPLDVIKTFPRQGYQWVQPVQSMLIQPSITSNQFKMPKYTMLLGVVFLSLLAAVFGWQQMADNESEVAAHSSTLSRELVVLPVINMIEDKNHAWVRLGAMDIIIKRLQAQRKFAVLDVEDVMMALARGDSFDLQNLDQQARSVRSNVGEAVTLQLKLLGSPMEYQLHYSLVGRYQQKQNIIYGETTDQLWQVLVDEILQHYQEPQSLIDFKQQYLDHQLLQAMEYYHRGQYEQAENYFNVVIDQQPKLVIAQRYLLKLLGYRAAFEQAEQVAQNALELAKKQDDMRELLRITFELGVIASRQQNFAKANTLLQHARELAALHNDKLYLAFAHTELAQIMVKQKNYAQAESLFKQALIYHESFDCPYGQVTNLHSLARLNSVQLRHQAASDYYRKAIELASINELKLEQVHLLLSQLRFSQYDGSAQEIAEKIQALLVDIPNQEIQKQVEEILDKHLG